METQSQTIGKIAEALAKAQAQIQVATYDSNNPHFKNKYASYESLRKICISPLSSNGISLMHQMIYTPDFKRIMMTQISHTSGEWFRSYLLMPCEKETPQGVGSAITYAKRYSLSSFLALCQDEDNDDGEKAEAPYRAPVPVSTVISAGEAKFLESLLVPGDKEFLENMLAWVSQRTTEPILSLSQLPVAAFEIVKKRVLSRVEERTKKTPTA